MLSMAKSPKKPKRSKPAPEEAPQYTPERIRALRERLGYTIEQVAAKVGVKPRTWQSWEQPSQDREPSESHLILLRLLDKNDGKI